MFCKNCGKELTDDSKFCPSCGTATESNNTSTAVTETPVASAPETPVQEVVEGGKKKKKHKGRFVVIIAIVAIIAILIGAIAAGGSGGSSSSESADNFDAIEMVKTGYLGVYTDATTQEILEGYYGTRYETLVWDGGKTDDGEFIVEFRGESKDGFEPIKIQFKLHDKQIFKLSGYDDGSDETEIAYYQNQLNFAYLYTKQYVMEDGSYDDIINELKDVPGSAVMYGSSKDYTGDRSKIGEEVYEEDPLNLSAAELLEYEFGGLLDDTEEPEEDPEPVVEEEAPEPAPSEPELAGNVTEEITFYTYDGETEITLSLHPENDKQGTFDYCMYSETETTSHSRDDFGTYELLSTGEYILYGENERLSEGTTFTVDDSSYPATLYLIEGSDIYELTDLEWIQNNAG